MVSVFTLKTEIRKARGHERTFRGDEYVYDLDCGDGIWEYAYVQTHQTTYIKYNQIFSILTVPPVMLQKCCWIIGILTKVLWSMLQKERKKNSVHKTTLVPISLPAILL